MTELTSSFLSNITLPHQDHHPHRLLPFFPPSLVQPTISSPRRRPPPRGVCMEYCIPAVHRDHHLSKGPIRRAQNKNGKDQIVVVMGATGCGKSRLSIDLATRFFPDSEIINSDKMQVYSGLDITTNKITIPERRGVPHHLLGGINPEDGEFSPSDFRLAAGLAVSDIASREKLPIVVGGSNSYIHALVVDRFDPKKDVFDPVTDPPVSTQFQYDCCFLWVDVSLPVLCDYLCRRVNEMLDLGMFEELSDFFLESAGLPAGQTGLRKAIGVPEFDRYFKQFPPRRKGKADDDGGDGGCDDRLRKGVSEVAVREIKENTCQLAKRQMGKIMKLKRAGWDLQRVDATEAFREAMGLTSGILDEDESDKNWRRRRRKKKKKKKRRWADVWETEVMEPSAKIVSKFLEEK